MSNQGQSSDNSTFAEILLWKNLKSTTNINFDIMGELIDTQKVIYLDCKGPTIS